MPGMKLLQLPSVKEAIEFDNHTPHVNLGIADYDIGHKYFSSCFEKDRHSYNIMPKG